MAVSTKMNVDVSGFKRGISQANASVKTLDAALKLNEKQFKANGDAETYMEQKTNLLNSKLQAQRSAVANAEAALKAMKDNGVSPISVAYQKMQQTMIGAQTALFETQMEIRDTGDAAQEAAGQVDMMTESVNGISKKMSLEQVKAGIDSITGGLENAAKKAADLGTKIWSAIMDSARWSDDTATAAMLLDMSVEEYQRYKDVFDTIAEMTVTDWMNAKRKVQKAINEPSNDQVDVLSALGISTKAWGERKGASGPELIAKGWEEVFWEAAKALQNKVERGEITQDMADTWGEALFGKKFASMKPLIDLGEEGFKAALEEQTVASEEAIKKNAELNDKIIQLKGDFTQLQAEITSGLAPALESAAGVLSSLLSNVMEYLQKPEGQKALSDLETAVSGLFEDLGKIDPEDVVSGFTDVFNTAVGSVQWLVEHWHGVVDAMTGIVVGWGALKLSGGALQILQLINGLKGLGGGSAAAGAAGAAAGASWGAGFASAVATAAPWLIGAYELTKVTGTAGDDQDMLFNPETGKLTSAGWEDFNRNIDQWAGDIALVGSLFGDLARITTDTNAINALANFRHNGGDLGKLIEDLQSLGYVLNPDNTGNSILENPEKWQDILQNGVQVPGEIQLPENEAEVIAAQVGMVTIPAQLAVQDTGGYGGGSTRFPFMVMKHANGLFDVPWDGYPAILHKGEQVVPAREVSNRNYNSNLYIENMNMSGNADAQGLAAAIAAANRRTMAGYGD